MFQNNSLGDYVMQLLLFLELPFLPYFHILNYMNVQHVEFTFEPKC